MRQVAIAARPTVSRDVADVLSSDGCEAAVRTLASNDNADISEGAMGKVVDRFGQTGSRADLYGHFGIDAPGIAEAAYSVLEICDSGQG